MGWEVIALGAIDFKEGVEQHIKEQFVEKLKGVDYIVRSELNKDWINVVMSGNKGINYQELQKLLNENENIIMHVSLSEYTETGENFYWGED